MSIFWATVYMELFDFGCLNCFVPNQSFWTMWLLNIQALIFSNIFSITVGYVQLNTVRNDPKSISKRRINKFQKENQYTEVRFAGFLSGGFITVIVVHISTGKGNWQNAPLCCSVAEIAEIEKATGDRIKTLLKYLLKVGKSQKVHLKFLICCLDAVSCLDHVILTVICFLTAAEFWNFSTVLMMGEKWKYTFWDLPTFTVWCARTVSFWNQRFERYDKHTQGYQMHCHGRKNGKKSHFWLIFGEFHTF